MNFIPEIERLLSGERNKFSELFGLVDGLMLTGSYATKSSTRNSDIDIIVLSRNVNYLYTESVCYGEKYVQLIFFPYYKFQDIIIQDINRGKGVYVSMIRNGIIFKDIASKILTKTKRFVLNTVDEIRCEQLDYGLIHKITSGVDVIKNSSSLTEKIYCASELLLDISRLITCKYVADAKHLSRIITSQFPDLAIFNSYQQFIKTNDPSIYIQDIEEILMNFGGPQYTWTSSWVFTYPHDHHIMVFFPMQRGNDMHFSKYLEDISVIANDCHIYGFYIGKNQNMEEGYYLFIYTDEVPIERIYRKIENFIKIILSGLHRTVQISFPYKTLFLRVAAPFLCGSSARSTGRIRFTSSPQPGRAVPGRRPATPHWRAAAASARPCRSGWLPRGPRCNPAPGPCPGRPSWSRPAARYGGPGVRPQCSGRRTGCRLLRRMQSAFRHRTAG